MHRNLDRRVEALVRVNDEGHRADLLRLLDKGMDPGTSSWWLGPDGVWTRHNGDADAPALDIQSHLMRSRRWRTVDGG